jgi:hypothetical protein
MPRAAHMGPMTSDEQTSGLTPRDILTGQLAALLPGLVQSTLATVADGLIGLGWRPAADASVTEEILSEHSFMQLDEGDGHHEPAVWWYSCSCRKVTYAEWIQKDPDMTGLGEFQQEGREGAMALHHAHVAGILTGTSPEDVPKPEYYALVTEDSIVAAANQLRAQLGDFTSPDVLMRKRAKFVLRAALPYLGAEMVR